ncbi:hypothetical protein QTI51_26680 [Variovorax sp. J22G73]|uniref:hypothetical protein n=1 Tax=unclassified Variovorax TaxID=663243 RepID=UPI002577F81A|nr:MULTISPECIES: hypothetical protein [unclassified Variovorax]MDM0008386.1 hypothetical protein [Variovorax sp. J22R203]MDM0100893.1 hypothetical protein [Variovorax sp. J22G73]
MIEPNAHHFLTNAFCRWVQLSRRDVLVSSLEALECGHDEVGNLVGAIPEHDDESAQQAIMPLAHNLDASDLALVCYALVMNAPAWRPLLSCVAPLQEIIACQLEKSEPPILQEDRGAVTRTPPDEDPSRDLSQPLNEVTDEAAVGGPNENQPSLSFGPENFQALEKEFRDLQRGLEEAVFAMTQERLPEFDPLSRRWVSLHARFSTFRVCLEADTDSLHELRDLFLKKQETLSLNPILERLLRVAHKSDPGYIAHHPVIADAERALALLKSGQTEQLQHLMPGLMSVDALVRCGGELEEAEAAAHDDLVRAAYGSLLAIALQRGRIIFAVLPPPPPAPVQDARSATDVAADDPLHSVTNAPALPVEAQPSPEETVVDPVGPLTSLFSAPDGATALQGGHPAEPDCSSSVSIPDSQEPSRGYKTAMEKTGAVESARPPSPTAETPRLTPSEGTAAEIEDALPYAATFSDFKKAAWVDPHGRVRTAPWVEPQFYNRIAETALQAWRGGELAKAYLCAKVSGPASQLNVEDLAAADRLLDRPVEIASLRDPLRAARLRMALQGQAQSIPTLAVAVTLEALAPTGPVTWSSEEAQQLCERAGFRSPALVSVLAFSLTAWSSAGDPLSLVRAFAEATPINPTQLAQQCRDAQVDLQRVVATQWNAAGGRITQNSSKKVWTHFVRDHVAPLRDTLAPIKSERDSSPLAADNARSKVEALGKAFAAMMKDGGVRKRDLSAAQSGAYQIVAAIERVVDAKSRLRSVTAKKISRTNLPHVEIEQLLADLPSDPIEGLCALMLRTAWTQKTATNPLRLPMAQLNSDPEIIRAISAANLASAAKTAGISVSDMEHPGLAAALISAQADPDPHEIDVATVFDQVREYGIEQDRSDILAALVPSGSLLPGEVELLAKRALALGDKAFESTRQLESIWAACDVLSAPRAQEYRHFVDSAYEACSFAAGDAPIAETLLLQAWLDRGLREASQVLDQIVRVRTEEAQRNSLGIGAQFEKLISVHDYRGAMELAYPNETAGDGEQSPVRRTMWRPEAVRKFPNPRAALVKERKGSTTFLSSLVSWWVSPGENDLLYRDTLRRSLYNVISGEGGHAQEVNKRRFGGRLAELRQHKERKTIINCAVLREWFQLTKLNPTFLPQLADFDEIVLASMPSSAQAGNAVDLYVRAAHAEGSRVLSVFLEPSISPGRRDEIASGLRKRQVPAVILDDLDICRLCLTDGHANTHDFVPFLEVVFEQLDLTLISPFSSLDGQHVRLESFVGRQQDAEDIAHRWEYSRLFSGRKLGKSALLRFVARHYEGVRLPSNKSLHVLFISIAGGASPEWVVDTIIDAMTKRFELWPEAEANSLKDAVDRFAAYMKRFAAERKDKNVLIILDEADAFVEEQLRRYERERDRSLSFNMMKRMPESEDEGMPRVRFLFAGYRITNTRGGVWANAGDVLVLKPLAEADATLFLQGMLARIGVDIGNHATFAARRCGYQPAVLIRFGDALLKRIQRNSRSPSRERLLVSHEDVLATMSDPAVMEEIRTVVNNNFQGNRVAAAVFAATLLALKDLEPGMALDDGPKHVLSKLRSIDPDSEWLTSRGSDPLAQVERQLQEFVDRELLTVSDGPRFGIREYRLKFQNFAPVLGQQDLVQEIRQHVQFLRSEEAPTRLIESVLSDTSLDAIRYVFRADSTEECALAIAAGHWMDALVDDKAGIADRLGYSTKAVAYARDPNALHEKLPRYRIYRGVSAAMLPTFIEARCEKPLLLIGGVDLLRDALMRQLEGSDTALDVRAFAPLSRATLSWWFENVQAYVFKRPEFVDQIFDATLGIPLLVGEFAHCLPKLPAEDVTAHDLEVALSAFRGKMQHIAQLLTTGPEAVRLTGRELELLRMIRTVVMEVQPSFDLQDELRVAWELCPATGLQAPFTDERDRISLQLLMSIGLLPAQEGSSVGNVTELGRVSIDRNSALFDLLAALGPIGAV